MSLGMSGMSNAGLERSEQSGASERVSGASKRANGRASGPLLQSVFLVDLAHGARMCESRKMAMSINGPCLTTSPGRASIPSISWAAADC